jgi:hypothetical protein
MKTIKQTHNPLKRNPLAGHIADALLYHHRDKPVARAIGLMIAPPRLLRNYDRRQVPVVPGVTPEALQSHPLPNRPHVPDESEPVMPAPRKRVRSKPLTLKDLVEAGTGAEFIPKRRNQHTPNYVLDGVETPEGGWVSYYKVGEKPEPDNDFDIEICSAAEFIALVARKA